MQRQILTEILEERVVTSRGKAQHRALKRAKPRYPRKHKIPPPNYEPVVVIVAAK